MQENSRLRQENSGVEGETGRGNQSTSAGKFTTPAGNSGVEGETSSGTRSAFACWEGNCTMVARGTALVGQRVHYKHRRKPVAVPIFAVRFTHRFVNASLAFGEEHGNAQENILKLYEQLFRGRVELSEIEPLVVKLPENCGDDLGIRSRNNRRLVGIENAPEFTFGWVLESTMLS